MSESSPSSPIDNPEDQSELVNPSAGQHQSSEEPIKGEAIGKDVQPEERAHIETDKRFEVYEGVLATDIEKPEQATEFVEVVLSEIDRAEAEEKLEIVREALDLLIDKRIRAKGKAAGGSAAASATNAAGEHGDAFAEIAKIFDEAIQKVEIIIGKEYPAHRAEIVIGTKLKEAQDKIDRGEHIHAIQLLYTALKNAGHGKYWSKNKDQKAEIEALLELTRKQWKEGGNKS